METKERMGIKGSIHIQLFGANNELIEERYIKNTVTPLGDAYVADCVAGRTQTQMSHMAIGTGTPSGTGMGNELDRNALTSVTQGTGDNDNDVVYVGDWAAGDGTGAITEAGIVNAATGGTFFVVGGFGVVNKGESDPFKVIWTITHGDT